MDELDRQIINVLQGGFPVCEHPFAAAAEQFNIDAISLITHIETLLEQGLLTRFGPLFNLEKLGGVYSLAAMKVPADVFENTAAVVNSFPEVAHNYERDHEFNMWFVLAADSGVRLEQVIDEIEKSTGIHVYNMPRVREYFVELKFHV